VAAGLTGHQRQRSSTGAELPCGGAPGNAPGGKASPTEWLCVERVGGGA
jgi:hypothetical protein